MVDGVFVDVFQAVKVIGNGQNVRPDVPTVHRLDFDFSNHQKQENVLTIQAVNGFKDRPI